MARRRSKASTPVADAASPGGTQGAGKSAGAHDRHHDRNRSKWWAHLFSRIASATSHYAGHPLTFLIAVSLVLIWALTGPLFGYSDTWQLVINTSTTIVTFLMVFLIQHTQNRDTLAVQLKLAELIMAVSEAENRLATAEDLSEEELEELHQAYRKRAEQTLEHLNQRRAQLKHAS
jgi:low affinity Fe/Cu permease